MVRNRESGWVERRLLTQGLLISLSVILDDVESNKHDS